MEVVRSYLRQTSLKDDLLIQELIAAATKKAEAVTGFCLIDSDFVLEIEEHDGTIQLPYPIIAEIDAVSYWDGEEWVEYDEADYDIFGTEKKYIVIDTAYQRIKVEYSSTATVNSDINRLMLELIAIWYDHRPDSEELEAKVVKKLAAYKIWQAA